LGGRMRFGFGENIKSCSHVMTSKMV
jgi:hypothetical protein